jgi:prevent-host-death family protein
LAGTRESKDNEEVTMTMFNVDIDQAKENLPELIEKTINNGEVIITRAGQPIAKIVSIKETKKERKFGTARGLIKISDDFDQPLDDFKGYM